MADRVSMPVRYYRTYPGVEDPTGHVDGTIELARGATALLIVDVYGKDFELERDPALEVPAIYRASDSAREIVLDRILPAREACHAAGVPVVYLENALHPWMTAETEWRQMSLRVTGVDVLQAWREPNEILGYSSTIAPAERDTVVRKQYYSGFFATPLEDTLNALGVRDLVMVGFDSRICLGNTATEAMYRGYRVTVLRDATETFEFPDTVDARAANLMAIRYIETNVGYTGLTADFIRAVEGFGDGGH
jgi:ureidoacrylate peracid hydrolase